MIKMPSFLSRFFSAKESQARIALSINQVGQPINSPRNYDSFATRGYQKNVIVYRCISLIAKSCAGIELELFSKKVAKGARPQNIESHPLLDLLNRPNPLQGYSAFTESFVSYFIMTGNTFKEAVRPGLNSPPMELWPVRPDKMKIIPNAQGYPGKYVFDANQTKKEWLVNPTTLQADIQHIKSFHPLNDWWGLSPIESAMMALDQNNQIQNWNLALLQNSATPSGVLKVLATDVNPAGTLSDDVFRKLKTEFEENYSGARNSGRPLLLEGGLDWQQISISPKDMEFLENKNMSAIDICTVFGVPPEMIGLGQKIYNNYKEARMSFYEDTILPLMDFLVAEDNNWLTPMFGDRLELRYNADDIEALAPKREAKFTSIQNANWLTQNEKREATGYEPVDGMDVFIIGSQVIDPAAPLAPAPGEEPVPEEETNEEDESEEIPEPTEDFETPPEEEQPKAWKSFNLLNQREKQTAWKRQNARKKRLEDNFTRDLANDFEELSRDLQKAVGKDAKLTEFAMYQALDNNMPIIKKTMSRHIGYTVDDFSKIIFDEAKSIWPSIETKANRKWEDWAQRFVQARTGEAISQIEGTTRKQVLRVVKRLTEEALTEGGVVDEGGEVNSVDFARALREEFSTLSKSRSRLIARTEISSAANNATLNAAKSLQIPGLVKEWISSQDDRVRDNPNEADHEVMNGVEVPLDEKFTVPPDADMDGPGDPAGGAGQICNCRCVLVFKSRNNGEL